MPQERSSCSLYFIADDSDEYHFHACELGDQLRKMTRMQLIRTLAAWRQDEMDYRNVSSAYRIAFKSLACRYLELHDEIADFDVMIAAIVDELAPEL